MTFLNPSTSVFPLIIVIIQIYLTSGLVGYICEWSRYQEILILQISTQRLFQYEDGLRDDKDFKVEYHILLFNHQPVYMRGQ